jgi:hypothetical protein
MIITGALTLINAVLFLCVSIASLLNHLFTIRKFPVPGFPDKRLVFDDG